MFKQGPKDGTDDDVDDESCFRKSHELINCFSNYLIFGDPVKGVRLKATESQVQNLKQ